MQGSGKQRILVGQLVRATALVWQSGRARALGNTALTLIRGLYPLLALWLLKLTVDAITDGIEAQDKTQAFTRAVVLIAIAGGSSLLNAAMESFSAYLARSQGMHFSDYMQGRVHAKSIHIDLEYFENPAYHDTLHRAQAEASSRPLALVTSLTTLMQSAVGGLAVLGLLIGLHWSIPLVLLLISAPALFIRIRFARVMYALLYARTPLQRMGGYLHHILTGDHYAKEVRIFGTGESFSERFRATRDTLRSEQLTVHARQQFASSSAQALVVITGAAIFAYAAFRAVNGQISIGDVVMYTQAFQRGQAYVGGLLRGLATLGEHSLFLKNLFEFLDLESRGPDPANPRPVPRPIEEGLVFDNVSFQYPTGTRPVLDSINLRIARNEVVALVGANGAGKTTIVKLLCRLYDPTDGAITLDGVDLREFGGKDYREHISVVFQDHAKYHLTAAENIQVGNIALDVDDPAIAAAARDAGADGIIESLPKGYNTVLGRWFEGGEELSIGEWQKLAIARALVKDAQIVALDEPTSAMDARSETDVFRAFKRLAAGRPGLLISHRFSTASIADRICVLADGKIIEEGSHDELVRLGGTYAELFESQARHYR